MSALFMGRSGIGELHLQVSHAALVGELVRDWPGYDRGMAPPVGLIPRSARISFRVLCCTVIALVSSC